MKNELHVSQDRYAVGKVGFQPSRWFEKDQYHRDKREHRDYVEVATLNMGKLYAFQRIQSFNNLTLKTRTNPLCTSNAEAIMILVRGSSFSVISQVSVVVKICESNLLIYQDIL